MTHRFRPGFWLSLFALIAFSILIALGTWQLQRLQWKQTQIAELEARMEEATTLDAARADPNAAEYRRLVLQGRYDHQRELHLIGRSYQGVTGLHVITPLRLDGGGAVLIERGWVPKAKRAPNSRPESLTPGTVEVSGVVKRGGLSGKSLFPPQNDPAANHWSYVDPPAMARAADLGEAVTAFYLVAVSERPESALPIAGPPPIERANKHLEYAVTWFALASALAAIYLLLGLKRGRERTPS